MLIEFRVENHRSIRDEQALTMEEGLVEDPVDLRPRAVLGHDKKLLPVAALYGANASGKSNVLHALQFMQEAVNLSHRRWAPDEGIQRKPFAWGEKRNLPSEYVAQFIIEAVRYEYGFVANDESFVEEWLFAWPNGRKQMWFEREVDKFKFGESLVGENELSEKITRPNSLFLSAAVQNRHEQLQPIYRWFHRQYFYHASPSVFFSTKLLNIMASTEYSKPHEIEVREDFLGFLRSADIGIIDVKVEHEEYQREDRIYKSPRFTLRHAVSDTEAWLPLSEQSRGTQTLFQIALPMLDAIRHGGVLIVDELEASLHPMLAAQIVRLFNDPKTNPKNAQLIFTTHDTNLLGNALGEPLLRRDQVWFTEKDNEGATKLYPLTDYKPRKAENLERGYLQGRYGAIPFLGDFRFGGEAE